MIGNAPFSESTSVPGWMTIAEERQLIELAKEITGVVVELGGEFGRSASQFAYANKDLEIYTIDLFENGKLEIYQSNLKEAGFKTTPIQGNTVQVARDWKKEIDLLFIDAGHHYKEVMADIENWTPFVKRGGYLVFHDVAKNGEAHYLHFDVKRALDEFRKENPDWQFFNGPDSLAWLQRPFKRSYNRVK